MKAYILVAVANLMSVGCALAANFEIQTMPNGQRVINMTGTIRYGDEAKFAQAQASTAILMKMNSPGGNVQSAIYIGDMIRNSDLSTMVPDGASCASACGYMWLSGQKRFLSPTGRVGFHAAFQTYNGRNIESGVGNALLGAYLGRLRIPDRAIIYMTTSGPTAMTWLDPYTSTYYGLKYFVADDQQVAAITPRPGYRFNVSDDAFPLPPKVQPAEVTAPSE